MRNSTSPTEEKARELVFEWLREHASLAVQMQSASVNGTNWLIDRITSLIEDERASRDAEIADLKFWLKQAKDWNTDVEEREAACCPEDWAFDEYIKVLKKQVEDERKAERERIRNRIKRLTNYTIEGRLFVLLDELLVITTTEEKQNLTLGPSK
jgi:hypothetical protein